MIAKLETDRPKCLYEWGQKDDFVNQSKMTELSMLPMLDRVRSSNAMVNTPSNKIS